MRTRLEALRESLERLGRYDPERSRQRFRASFEPTFTRHIVVLGARFGFIALKPCHDAWLLDQLHLRPQQQRRGIGGAVLNRIVAEADAAGVAVRVGALRDSTANHFYARHGFERVGEGEWDIHYVRALRGTSSTV